MWFKRLWGACPNGRVLAFALATILIVAAGPQGAFPQNVTGEGSASSENSSGSGGQNSSSASQNSGISGNTETDPSGGTSTANGSGSAEASQQSGGTSSSAGAETTATANAGLSNGVFSANATATGTGEGSASGGGSANAGTTVTANASATGGPVPTAEASTINNGTTTTSATAVVGQQATAIGGTQYTKEKVGKKKSVAIALNTDGSYSVAIAKKKSSFAYSGIYDSDFDKFSGKDLVAAAKAAAGAYAKVTENYAEAGSWAKGRGGSASSGGGGGNYVTSSNGGHYGKGGFAWAQSGAQAYARVEKHPLVASPAPRAFNLASCEWVEVERILYCRKYK